MSLGLAGSRTPGAPSSRPIPEALTPHGSIYLQVVWLEQMAIAANIGYVHGLADAFHGKAHHLASVLVTSKRAHGTNKNKSLQPPCGAEWQGDRAENRAYANAII
jgi:hypothetical protein